MERARRRANLEDMTANTLGPAVATEQLVTHDGVLGWRTEQLVAAGYRGDEVLRLAERSDVDLHLAVRLLAAGCPSETALRILL